MSKETFFQAKRSHSLSWSSVLRAGSLYLVLWTIVQMVCRGLTSREFASPSPLAIKFVNPFDTMSACAPPFSLQGFPTFVGHISSYCCTRNFYIVKLNFFTFLSCRIITHILTAFSITFLAHLKNNGYPFLGLSSKVFTFDHLFTCSLKYQREVSGVWHLTLFDILMEYHTRHQLNG